MVSRQEEKYVFPGNSRGNPISTKTINVPILRCTIIPMRPDFPFYGVSVTHGNFLFQLYCSRAFAMPTITGIVTMEKSVEIITVSTAYG